MLHVGQWVKIARWVGDSFRLMLSMDQNNHQSLKFGLYIQWKHVYGCNSTFAIKYKYFIYHTRKINSQKREHFHLSAVISGSWWYQMLHPHTIMILDIFLHLVFSDSLCSACQSLVFFLECVIYVWVCASLHIINTPEGVHMCVRACLLLLSTWFRKCVSE